MICEICGREKDENTVLCTNCGPQCEYGGSCGSHTKENKKEIETVESINKKFSKGYSKN